MSTSTTLSQISCFSSINQTRKLRLGNSPSLVCTQRPIKKFSVCMHLDDSGTQTHSSETEGNLRSKVHVEEEAVESYPISEGVNGSVPEQDVSSQKKTAKIHDFCLGIPFGGFVLTGGVFGSILSRNFSTLGTGVLLGGGLLALSTFSLKVWRERKSSLPFILGQAALAGVLLWKNLQRYSLTKKVFPAGLYVAISAAMLCFYSYVIAAGGNPPPKNKKLIAKSAL